MITKKYDATTWVGIEGTSLNRTTIISRKKTLLGNRSSLAYDSQRIVNFM